MRALLLPDPENKESLIFPNPYDERVEKMEKMPSLLNPKQVKEILGCSLPLVYKLAENGKLPSVKYSAENGKRQVVRFEPQEVERFIERHRQ